MRLVFIFTILNILLFADKGGIFAKETYTIRFLFSFPEDEIKGMSLSQPQGLAISNEGNVFVTDTGNNRILKFDRDGDFVFSNGGFGWDSEQFDRPLDVSAKWGLDVFVADYNNERIERYDKKLNYISSLRADDIDVNRLSFGFPTSVDISRHGELFVCDNENDRILKLNASGDPDLVFGDFNWGEGQLQHPVKIEITTNDQVYVTDREANDIVVYDYYGNYIFRFGENLLSAPNGLAWSDGLLFVADSGNNRVVVFNREHKNIFAWGEEGSQYGAFRNPVDVATFNNKVYVLDSDNHRIQVFQLIAPATGVERGKN